MFNKIVGWLRGDDARVAFDAQVAQLAREAGTRFARGNISIQLGAVQTPDDLERARASLRRELKKTSAAEA